MDSFECYGDASSYERRSKVIRFDLAWRGEGKRAAPPGVREGIEYQGWPRTDKKGKQKTRSSLLITVKRESRFSKG